MNIKFKIFFIVSILISTVFILGSNISSNQYYQEDYFYIELTENLKQNYIEGSDICKEKNFYSAIEYEVCVWENVRSKSQEDYKKLREIRYYCLDKTDNEYDRRECIENFIHKII